MMLVSLVVMYIFRQIDEKDALSFKGYLYLRIGKEDKLTKKILSC